MSDELQEAFEIDGEIEQVAVEPETTDAPEEAPATEGEKLSGYDKRISVLTARLREKEQKLAQFEAERATKEELVEQPPELPELPDDDLRYQDPAAYRIKMRERDKAIAEHAAFIARQSLKEQSKVEAARNVAEAKRSQNQEIVSRYIENGLMQGVTEDRMLANEKVLQSAKVSPDLAVYLFSEENGAKVVDYLAKNPEQLMELAAMPVAMAAVQIATKIKPKALANKPHVTNAPEPTATARSSGKPPKDDWSKLDMRATFE